MLGVPHKDQHLKGIPNLSSNIHHSSTINILKMAMDMMITIMGTPKMIMGMEDIKI